MCSISWSVNDEACNPSVRYFKRVKFSIRSLARFAAVSAPVAVIALSLFVQDWPARRFLAFYVAPLLLVFFAWLWLRLGETSHSKTVLILDAIVVGVASLRFFTGAIPLSGHMLFLSYSGLTQRASWYRILALAIAIETTVFKLWIWRDVTSWSIGTVAGVTAFLLHTSASKRSVAKL